MKTRPSLPATASACALALLLGACASPSPTPGSGGTAPGAAAPSGPAAPAAAAAPARPAPVGSSSVATVQAPAAPQLPSTASIYFALDEHVLDSEDNTTVERWGRYLVAQPALALRIEGNTDERGSREYNLALGQRRAQSVVDALRAYGIPGARLEAVSYGEERPRAEGQSEDAWAQNRRADLRPQR